MAEFRRMPWSLSDVGTDFQQTYELNMPNFQNRNTADVLFCNLLDIDPLHLQHKYQNPNECTETEKFAQTYFTKFIDPRTGIEIPTHECNYKDTDLKLRNIFLTNCTKASSLQRHEHKACLNALGCLSKPASELSIKEKRERLLFDSTVIQRCEEKNMFLEELREHYFKKSFKRFHSLPPSIENFITQKWKKQLIVMHRQFANIRFSLKTAILLQSSAYIVKTKAIHQEHLGNVPQMSSNRLDYLRQSFPNLMKAYHKRKNIHIFPEITEKLEDLVQQHRIDFIIPISVLKCILSSKKGWSFCMTVRESILSTAFNPKKEIICEKPLPPAHLSESINERNRRGAKYLMHSCFNENTLNVFNRNENRIHTQFTTETTEYDFNPNTEIVYNISNCDKFMSHNSTNDSSYGNMTFTIFDMNGYNSNEGISEWFKILVPTKQATYKKDNEDIKFINLSPKVEYQSEYGAEVMRKDELISEWCDLCFRPKTSTERVRFDCITGKVIHRQSITLIDVEDELRKNYGIETQQLLQRLWYALQTFIDFPLGNYLLQSDLKKLDYIKIYDKTENCTESIGISEIIKNVTLEKDPFEEVNWQPIDENIVNEIHRRYEILPCAFPHKDYLRQNNMKWHKSEQTKPIGGSKTNKMLKICPKDDSRIIISGSRSRKKKEKKQFNSMMTQAKKHKKLKNRAQRRTKQVKQKDEIEGLESAKHLLDQYNAASSESLAVPQ